MVALVLAGCTQSQLNGFLPGFDGKTPVTNHTERVSGLWVTSWIVLLLVGLVVWGLIIWCVIVYRRRKGQTGLPAQLRYNMPIEIFYTIVPCIVNSWLYCSRVCTTARPGSKSWARMISAMMPPMQKYTNDVIGYMYPIVL